jgi:cullin-4
MILTLVECGPGFTTKLEGMFRDMELSKDIMLAFQNSPRHTSQLISMDFTVNILTAGFWPTYPVIELNLPEAVFFYLPSSSTIKKYLKGFI